MNGIKEESYHYFYQILQDLKKEIQDLKQYVEDDHIRQLDRINQKHKAEIRRINKKYQERKENRSKELIEHLNKCEQVHQKLGLPKETNSQNDKFYKSIINTIRQNEKDVKVSELFFFDEIWTDLDEKKYINIKRFYDKYNKHKTKQLKKKNLQKSHREIIKIKNEINKEYKFNDF